MNKLGENKDTSPTMDQLASLVYFHGSSMHGNMQDLAHKVQRTILNVR